MATAPAQALPARQASPLRDGAVVAGAGLIAAGMAQLATWPTWTGPTAAVTLAVGGVAVAVTGLRGVRRHELEDRLVEALAPLLGVRRPDRRTVRLSRWTSGWPGTPRRISIRYAPGAIDNDPQWLGAVTGLVEARLLAPFLVAQHDRRGCRLVLTLAPPAGEEAPTPPASRVRAEKIINELVGPTSVVTGEVLEGEQLLSITAVHEAGTKVAASGYRARIERVFTALMPGRWRAVWDLENDTVRFELRPHLPSSVWLPGEIPADPGDLLENYGQVRIPYAVDEDGEELAWSPAVSPHLLLIGGTGTGKTSTAHALTAQVAAHGWPVWVADAKRIEFLEFRGWPNVQIVATTIPQQIALIHRAWELMETRYAWVEHGQARREDFEPLVVILDEYAEFVQGLLEWYPTVKVKGDPAKPPTLAQVASLARKARSARVHLIVSMQRPDIALIGGTGEMRDNFGQRVSMGRLSPQGALMMWENPTVGVSLPRSCIGRATATNSDGRAVEAQCYRFPPWDAPAGSAERELLDRMEPEQSRHPQLVIVPAEEGLDPEAVGAGEAAPTIRDYMQAEWVLAERRPDLDPLSGWKRDAGQGLDLSSPLASLGLGEVSPRDSGRIAKNLEGTFAAIARDADTEESPQPRRHLTAVVDLPAVPDLVVTDTDDVDLFVGYGDPTSCFPHRLAPGDLIQVDDVAGGWAVVDEVPEEDLAAPGLMTVSWRGDCDEAGILSVPADAKVEVRRPEEDQA